MKPTLFATPTQWRNWLEKNHASAKELWVGFHRKASGRPSITWPESVDEALCFGWIDGLRKSIDENIYMIRFSPRRPESIWSRVNIKRVGELTELGLMHASGLKLFESRDQAKAELYSSEQRNVSWPAGLEKQFKKNKKAWDFFRTQPPGYQKTLTWWMVSAKREETQLKRLQRVMDVSARGKRVDLESPLQREV